MHCNTELRLVPWAHWHLELATLQQNHLKASFNQWVAMRCCWKMLPDNVCLWAKCTKLGALLGLWLDSIFQLGSNYHLKTMMQRYYLWKRNKKNMMHLWQWLNFCLEKTESSSVVQNWPYQMLNHAPCCLLVPRHDSVVQGKAVALETWNWSYNNRETTAGILESMPGGDLRKLHSETLQWSTRKFSP